MATKAEDTRGPTSRPAAKPAAKPAGTESRTAPSTAIPAKRTTEAVHGPQEARQAPRGGLERLRALLTLSGEVNADRVCNEAADAIESLRTAERKPRVRDDD